MKAAYLALVAIALLAPHALCEPYGEEGEEPYPGEGEEGYGGGEGGGYGGEDEMPPPPPPDSTQELTSLAEFEAFIDNMDASVIAAFTQKQIVDPKASMPDGWDTEEDGEWEPPVIENPTLTSFNTISTNIYGYRYAFTTSPEVLEKLKCKNSGLFLYRSPKFVSVKDGDRPRERFPSATLTESAVSNWLAAKAQPLVGMYSPTTKDRYKSAVLVVFMNLDFEKNAQSVQYVLKRARKAAAALKGKLSIAVGSLSELSYELSDFGLTSNKPTADILMGIRDGANHYSGSDFFSQSGESAGFSGKTLSMFADAYVAGSLTPYVKPDEPTGGDEPPAEDEDYTEGDEKEEM
ncbi:hypothetical protein AB1Y20_018776 [Prymnesium parvum]|uniref:protein disulfide-isomerase n=1 Tax=Prymnesium parvum TaxID=97485 RepID=A0AB34JT38_PRYPA